jgi:cytochrome P450
MMAAHDTLASSLSSFVYFLAVNPRWQEKLREEAQALGLARGEPLPYERLDDLPLTEMAFKESLRLIPPVPSIPRCAMRDTEFAGHPNSQGRARERQSALHPPYAGRLARAAKIRSPALHRRGDARARHKYAFVPYGGGAHMCLGLRFAYMQAKCFAYHLLTTSEVSAPPNYRPDRKYWPIPKPRDGLQVKLTPLQ